MTADGAVALEKSTIGGLAIDTAHGRGQIRDEVADLTTLQVSGPGRQGRCLGARRARSDVGVEPEVSRRGDRSRRARRARRAEGCRRLGGPRRHDHRQRRVAADHRDARRQQPRVRENKALDLNSQYSVTVPDLEFKKAHVEATYRHVRQGRRARAECGHREDHLRGQTAAVHDQHQGADARARRDRRADPSSRSPGGPPAAARRRTQGIEWRTRRAARRREIRPRPRRDRQRAAGERPIRRST